MSEGQCGQAERERVSYGERPVYLKESGRPSARRAAKVRDNAKES